FTILFLVLVLVWALALVIRPGSYAYVSCDEGTPKPIPGTFANTTVDLSIVNRLYDLWLSPVNGLYGIRTPSEPIPNPPAEMAEETLGFYAIIVPVIVGIGYDRMVGVSLIMVGAGVGTLASTVNPFATGVASAGGDVALGNGIALRILMYLVLTAVSVFYVLR